MASKRLIPIISSVSLGIGCFLGTKFERYSSTSASQPSGFDFESKGKDLTESIACETETGFKYCLPIPVVKAATSVVPSTQDVTVSARSLDKPKGSRVSEIMRHGFPSLDNLRTYDDYVLAYDKRMRTAQWVFEHLTAERVTRSDHVDRSKSAFTEDASIHEYFRATNADYKGSGYDRGHLAAAGNHAWGQKAMDQTFTLSNMSPQVGKGFNRDAWNKLEKFVRHLTKKYPNVYVCTGPLYLPRRETDGKMYVKYEVIGWNHVSVPTHFFKVVVMETDGGDKELLSFVMPNHVLPEKLDLKSYLVPSDVIERASGLLFFEKIPPKTFVKINGKKT